MRCEGHRGHHKQYDGKKCSHRGESIAAKTEGEKIIFLEQLMKIILKHKIKCVVKF